GRPSRGTCARSSRFLIAIRRVSEGHPKVFLGLQIRHPRFESGRGLFTLCPVFSGKNSRQHGVSVILRIGRYHLSLSLEISRNSRVGTKASPWRDSRSAHQQARRRSQRTFSLPCTVPLPGEAQFT